MSGIKKKITQDGYFCFEFPALVIMNPSVKKVRYIGGWNCSTCALTPGNFQTKEDELSREWHVTEW